MMPPSKDTSPNKDQDSIHDNFEELSVDENVVNHDLQNSPDLNDPSFAETPSPTQTTKTEKNNSAAPTSFGSGDPTDGRKKFEWKSGYSQGAEGLIFKEAKILLSFFVISLIVLFLTWTGTTGNILESLFGIDQDKIVTFKYYAYFSFAGLLGGTILSIKFLYHAVARGIWHVDRTLWRYITPWMSFGVAFVVAALIHYGLFGDDTAKSIMMSGAGAVSFGFLSGYFSDNAIAKMYELANVFFGTSNSRSSDKK